MSEDDNRKSWMLIIIRSKEVPFDGKSRFTTSISEFDIVNISVRSRSNMKPGPVSDAEPF